MLLKFLWITAFGLMMLSLLIMFLTLLDVDVYKYLRGTARIIGALLGQIFYRLPRFLLRKIFMAIPWAMAACAALTFGVFAIGRQFFSAGDAKIFL